MRRKILGVPVIVLVALAVLLGGAAAAYAALTRVSNIVEWEMTVVKPTPTPTPTRIASGGSVELQPFRTPTMVNAGVYDYALISAQNANPTSGTVMEVDLYIVVFAPTGRTPSPSMLTASCNGQALTFTATASALVASVPNLKWSTGGTYSYKVEFMFTEAAHAGKWKWNIYAMAG